MPGQTTRGDMVFTWTEILGARPDAQQAPLGNIPAPYNELGRMRPVVEATRPPYDEPDRRDTAMSRPFEGRAELEIDRNHWKREALRYKQLLMDMLGKEVE